MSLGIAGKKTQKCYSGNCKIIFQDIFQFSVYHGDSITTGFTHQAADKGLNAVFLFLCPVVRLFMISLRQTTAIRPAINCRLATTVMIFTGKFIGCYRYSEGDATATQGEAEKNEDLNTGKNLVRFAHSCIRLKN